MKKLMLVLLLISIITACKKENFQHTSLKRGTIVDEIQSIPLVNGPFRVDSISRISNTIDDANWYWITSNNGVDLEVNGYYMTKCNNCNYTWVGPSKYVPGNPLILRNGDN
jgi:hypothetical protein